MTENPRQSTWFAHSIPGNVVDGVPPKHRVRRHPHTNSTKPVQRDLSGDQHDHVNCMAPSPVNFNMCAAPDTRVHCQQRGPPEDLCCDNASSRQHPSARGLASTECLRTLCCAWWLAACTRWPGLPHPAPLRQKTPWPSTIPSLVPTLAEALWVLIDDLQLGQPCNNTASDFCSSSRSINRFAERLMNS